MCSNANNDVLDVLFEADVDSISIVKDGRSEDLVKIVRCPVCKYNPENTLFGMFPWCKYANEIGHCGKGKRNED